MALLFVSVFEKATGRVKDLLKESSLYCCWSVEPNRLAVTRVFAEVQNDTRILQMAPVLISKNICVLSLHVARVIIISTIIVV